VHPQKPHAGGSHGSAVVPLRIGPSHGSARSDNQQAT
jgi:hypothetical protein